MGRVGRLAAALLVGLAVAAGLHVGRSDPARQLERRLAEQPDGVHALRTLWPGRWTQVLLLTPYAQAAERCAALRGRPCPPLADATVPEGELWWLFDSGATSMELQRVDRGVADGPLGAPARLPAEASLRIGRGEQGRRLLTRLP